MFMFVATEISTYTAAKSPTAGAREDLAKPVVGTTTNVILSPTADGNGTDGQATDGAAEILSKAQPDEPGFLDRLKGAVSTTSNTAKKAPETFEEALAVLRGEGEVKPDFERAAYTVSAVS